MVKYLQIVQIIISIALIAVILLQVKGEGLSGTLGAGIYKTRRGAEKTLFNLAIVLSGLFFLVSLIAVMLQPA